MTEVIPLSSPADLDNPLWKFALHFWQIPGVEAECLALQSEGWHVTRLLGACWLASLGMTHQGGKNNELDDWRHQVTGQLRDIRKQIDRQNPALASVRSCISRAELEAERVELALFYRANGRQADKAEPGTPDQKQMARNLRVAAPDHTTNNELTALAERFCAYLSAQLTGEQTR